MNGRRAVLDLGSNSFHLLVADVDGLGRIHRVATSKRQLRLAEPVATTGRLGPDAIERAARAVADLLQLAEDRDAETVTAVATDAVRRAEDGDDLCTLLHERYGLDVRILSGEEEATLSLEAMRAALAVPVGIPLLGLDLGGGSFEAALGDGRAIRVAVSTPYGAAALTASADRDPPRLASVAALHERALASFRPAAEILGGRAVEAAGTAGTIRDLGRAANALATGEVVKDVRGVVVTREALEAVVPALLAVDVEGRRGLPGVGEKRADLLPAGGIVVLAAMEAFGAQRLTLCDWGLREGALLAEVAAGLSAVPDG